MAAATILSTTPTIEGKPIVGIDIDYETVGTGSMLMVCVSGTAVTVG